VDTVIFWLGVALIPLGLLYGASFAVLWRRGRLTPWEKVEAVTTMTVLLGLASLVVRHNWW
jgi:hypothetical protein